MKGMSAMITPNGDQIGAYEAAGLVTVREHKDLPLRIVNYTPRVQYERCWTAELLQCRGLVVDAELPSGCRRELLTMRIRGAVHR